MWWDPQFLSSCQITRCISESVFDFVMRKSFFSRANARRKISSIYRLCVCWLCWVGLVMQGRVRLLRPAKTWPTQTRQNGDNQEKEGGEESAAWPGNAGNVARAWRDSSITPLPSSGSGQSPPWGLPPHHDQPPTPILNPQPTQI